MTPAKYCRYAVSYDEKGILQYQAIVKLIASGIVDLQAFSWADGCLTESIYRIPQSRVRFFATAAAMRKIGEDYWDNWRRNRVARLNLAPDWKEIADGENS